MAEVDGKIETLLHQLSQDGLLNDQFQQLMQLQDESNPNFVKEVVELYFQDSAVKLERLSARLAESPPDYSEVDALVHQFKGSSASFGAQTITQYCVQLREACHRRDQRGCQALLEQVKQNYTVLKSKLEVFMQLEQKRKDQSRTQ
jgi:histidine-containing phosphotransfer protein